MCCLMFQWEAFATMEAKAHCGHLKLGMRKVNCNQHKGSGRDPLDQKTSHKHRSKSMLKAEEANNSLDSSIQGLGF